jgi:peptide subunit release factor 1 (eRF1)
VIEDLKVNEEKKELEYVEKLIESGLEKSSAGIQDTLKLIEEGRADKIFIPANKSIPGWKCNGCLYFSRDQFQAGCPYCKEGYKKIDLIEEIIRLNLQKKGKFEMVKDKAAEKLEIYGGIGALIRY